MKRIFSTIILTLLLLYLLVFPKQMAQDTAAGLLLWYKSVVPTLLPFCMISYIIIQSNLYHSVFQKILKALPGQGQRRPEVLYPLCLGLICGFPIGAKLTGDMYALGHLSGKTATRLCAMSNHFGPAFVVNYIGLAQLHSPQAVPLLLVCIYAPPLILGSIWMAGVKEPAFRHEKPASRSQINFKIIDAGIINGFETMLRIAGYIVIFSILSGALDQLPLSAPLFKAVGTGILEVTTGSEAVASSCADFTRKLVLICAMVSFGGFCGIFQTKAIMKNTPFRLSEYILFKFLCSAGSALLAVLLVYLFF